MTSSYEVQVTATARQDLRDIPLFLRDTGVAHAIQWLVDIWDAMMDLETLPRRAARASQSNHLDYEVRRRVVGDTLIFFHIDEPRRVANVLGVWPARRNPLAPDAFAPLPDERTRSETEE